MEISPVGDFKLQWGESVRWDERRQRLYFVDCAAQKLHWLDGAEPPLRTLDMPSIPTGVVLCEDDRIVVALDDGFHVLDPDAGTRELLCEYPEGLGGRANDANADLNGGLITGTLNLVPAPGSYWRYSRADGWSKLDDGIGSANGPVVLEVDGEQTLVVGDTFAGLLYAYAYSATGIVGERRVFADTKEVGGLPDGACADAQGGVWSCLFGGGKIVRYTPEADVVIDAGVEMPSDVTFGGPVLDRMFFVSIAVPVAGVEPRSPHAGRLMVVDGAPFPGRAEPRFRL